MSTPIKSLALVKKHLTIAEKKARMRKEADLTTGSALQEWPEIHQNKIASARFYKTKNLLASIGKDDALLEPVINRYALLIAECSDFEDMIKSFRKSKNELQEEYLSRQISDEEEDGLKPSKYYSLLAKMQESIINADRQLQAKRKMLLDIEKENAMTLLSQLRTTTKQPQNKEKDSSGEMFG